jgi:glycosyltransferase involved in cell wall biosynthesis
MLRLAQSPDLRSSMGRAARQRVEREFDWSRKVDRVMTLYQHVIAANHSGRRTSRSAI